MKIEIMVNSRAMEIEEGTTLTKLLEQLGYALDGTAVALDDQIVPKSTFDQKVVTAEARIEVFSLVAGG